MQEVPNLFPHKWLVMTGIGLGVFMSTLDGSIVNISLPTLVDIFHTDLATIQWVVLSYILVTASLMLTIARLGDMRGKKKLYLTGLILFTGGSLLCGTSPNVYWLIGFRALQGLGATMMAALGTAIITENYPSSERGRALGLIGSIVSIGIAIGPPLGGILIGLTGWRSIFLVNVPVGILTTWVVSRYVPATAPKNKQQRFDLSGALILLLTLGSYAFGMTMGQNLGFGVPTILALLGAAGVGLVAFVLVELRQTEPMVDLRLFRNPLFSINLLMGFLVFMALGGTFILPFFLQLVQGYTIEQVGLLLMVQPVIVGLLAPISGSLSDRFGSRVISLVGLAIVVAGCLYMSTLTAAVTTLGFGLRLAVFGVGMAIFQSPNNSAIMGAAPHHKLGIASGLIALSRTLGQTSGMPLMGALFTAQVLAVSLLPHGSDVTNAPATALVSGVNDTYRMAAWVMLVSTLLAALALWLDYRNTEKIRNTEGVKENENTEKMKQDESVEGM
jgi:EmrB/QacA subfamily drug resistance transporter